MDTPRHRRVASTVDDETYTRLRIASVRHNISSHTLIREAIVAYLDLLEPLDRNRDELQSGAEPTKSNSETEAHTTSLGLALSHILDSEPDLAAMARYLARAYAIGRVTFDSGLSVDDASDIITAWGSLCRPPIPPQTMLAMARRTWDIHRRASANGESETQRESAPIPGPW